MYISIHALREEGDQLQPGINITNYEFLSTPSVRRATERRNGHRGSQPISIHALREEGDQFVNGLLQQAGVFLSTPSARRATAKTEKNISAFVSV